MRTKLNISIIIPVYNEEKRLGNLEKIISFLKDEKINSEIILVNDGSKDNTFKILQKFKKNYNLSIISYQKNRGKGYAIKQGMLSAKGDYCFFLDIDLSTPIEEIQNFAPLLYKYDVIIASRKMKNSRLSKRQPLVREFLGKVFTALSKIILGVNVSDFTCGFKCFSKKSVGIIFPKLTIDRWGFDSEVLFIATKEKFRIKEVSVAWSDDSRTKVKFPQDIINSFLEILKIRWNQIKGIYD